MTGLKTKFLPLTCILWCFCFELSVWLEVPLDPVFGGGVSSTWTKWGLRLIDLIEEVLKLKPKHVLFLHKMTSNILTKKGCKPQHTSGGHQPSYFSHWFWIELRLRSVSENVLRKYEISFLYSDSHKIVASLTNQDSNNPHSDQNYFRSGLTRHLASNRCRRKENWLSSQKYVSWKISILVITFAT